MAIVTEAVHYRDGSSELTGALFREDTRTDRRAGILVVHGGSGLDDHAKSRARGFAELGFVVLACDMYGEGVAGSRERIMAQIAELRAAPMKLCQRARAGLDVLAAHPQVDGRFAAVGYCFGGMTVLELARSGADLAGIVSVHGSLQTSQPAEPGAIKAKVLVCHGALDPHVPTPHVTGFMEEMNQAGGDWQLNVYGGALHGFTHKTPSAMPGVAYNPTADARSGEAIELFFREIFRTRENSADSDSLTPLRATP